MEKSSFHPYKDNEALLKKIINKNKNTEYGISHSFDKIRSVNDFQRQVPISSYLDFLPYIERLKNNEENLLTKSKILGYSRTSGSSGLPKYIPVTKDSLTAYTKYTWIRALALAIQQMKKQGKRYKSGRGICTLPSVDDCLPNGLLCSNIAELGFRKFGFISHYYLTLPWRRAFNIKDGDFRYCIYRFALEDEDTLSIFSVFLSMLSGQLDYLMANWSQLVDDIEKGTIGEKASLNPKLREALVKKLKPNPKRAVYLRRQFERGFNETILKRIWPNLSVITGIGTASFQKAADCVRKYADGIPLDFSVYAASEGMIAACYRLECQDMQLLTDSCFFEFIPENGDEEKVMTLDQLEKGERYEVIITTQSGLYRYRIQDIVEVTGFRNRCPLICFRYRRGQLLNISGEKFSEDNARQTISIYEQRHNLEIPHWIFYEDDSVMPSRYTLLIECPNILPESAAEEIEEIIGECNHRYIFQKDKHDIGSLVIKYQIPGTHYAWIKYCISKGAFDSQIKPVHTLDNEEKKEFFLHRILD